MRILSGIQPSGELHIGNYLGAMKNFVALQEEHEGFYCIVDLHALTNLPEPDELRAHTLDAAIGYLAVGLDPQKATIFLQSDVPAHVGLMWLLTTVTSVGELERMTQYKEKAHEAKRKDFINAGLFMYPVLMAADILVYRPDAVPVGDEQKQHLELTRHIARRFNQRFGKLFPEPKPLIPKYGARVMSLTDPKKKMSKSHGPETYIGIFDEPDTIRKKVKKAVTDSGTAVVYEPVKKPALANLLEIYALFADETPKQSAKRFAGKGYAELKSALADLLVEKLAPFRERRTAFVQSPAHVKAILKQGAVRARSVAEETLREARKRMGLQ